MTKPKQHRQWWTSKPFKIQLSLVCNVLCNYNHWKGIYSYTWRSSKWKTQRLMTSSSLCDVGSLNPIQSQTWSKHTPLQMHSHARIHMCVCGWFSFSSSFLFRLHFLYIVLRPTILNHLLISLSLSHSHSFGNICLFFPLLTCAFPISYIRCGNHTSQTQWSTWIWLEAECGKNAKE